jgi:hypothetical protein
MAVSPPGRRAQLLCSSPGSHGGLLSRATLMSSERMRGCRLGVPLDRTEVFSVLRFLQFHGRAPPLDRITTRRRTREHLEEPFGRARRSAQG